MNLSILTMAWRSLLNRHVTAVLTVTAIALAVALFLGVEKIRRAAKSGFDNTISGTDLIVGAPSGSVNLLLYSVFRLGNATAGIAWSTHKAVSERDDVAWTVPLMLGDNHRGFRVLGTNEAYFEHYRYAGRQALAFADGSRFEDVFDAVIGARVARKLGYRIGSPLVLTHGLGVGGLADHDNRPFRVVGILKPTGTPVDGTVHIPLEGVTAMHVGWETGFKTRLADMIGNDTVRRFDLTPKSVTAILVGLKNRATVLRTRRALNTAMPEPLLAIIPGQALTELWQVMATAERVLVAVSVFVVVIGLVSVLTSILTSLNERRREMSILRAVGARPRHILVLMVAEAGVLGVVGALAGVVLIQVMLVIAAPFVSARYGIVLAGTGVSMIDLYTVVCVTLAACFLGIWPALTAMRRSLADGLAVKI